MFIDLTGQKFGRLTAISVARKNNKGAVWNCRCDCGGQLIVSAGALRKGNNKSCGCYHPTHDLTGRRFGRATALSRAIGPGQARWNCQCDCGKKWVVSASSLLAGLKSCGCLDKSPRRHGQSKPATGTYQSWAGMNSRCSNLNDPRAADYVGRGISVCKRWKRFENFRADMGERPEGMSIDRIDNNGNYEPSNCRWATTKQQAQNTRRTKIIEYNGARKPLTEWSYETGIPHPTLYSRLKRGWSVADTLGRPVVPRAPVLSPQQIAEIRARFRNGERLVDVAGAMNRSPQAIWPYKPGR